MPHDACCRTAPHTPLLPNARTNLTRTHTGNPSDFYCWTALHKGAYAGSVEAVDALLIAGADIEARDSW